MTKQTEALKMAIEVFDMYGNKMNSAFADEAYQACKEALAETQEAVAYIMKNDVGMQITITKEKLDNLTAGWTYIRDVWKNATPLYTTPPSREWQSLSDDEIEALWGDTEEESVAWGFAHAIEAKLREKNT